MTSLFNESYPHWTDQRYALGPFQSSSSSRLLASRRLSCNSAERLDNKDPPSKVAATADGLDVISFVQSSCNTPFFSHVSVPSCYSESGKGDAAITSQALGAL